MPNEADPSYAAWAATLSKEIDALEDGAILIGHSIGGTVLIHALAEAPPKRKPAGVSPRSPPTCARGVAECLGPLRRKEGLMTLAKRKSATVRRWLRGAAALRERRCIPISAGLSGAEESDGYLGRRSGEREVAAG